MCRITAALLVGVMALSAVASALDGPEFHGFISPAALKSSANDYLAKSHRGSFELTEAALNATEVFSPSLRMGAQIFSSQIGSQGGFETEFDWYYLDWHRYSWLGLRAGRVKVPFGLFNELSDYDPGRLTVLLPQSVYPLISRNFLLSATGLDLYGRREIGPAGALAYSLVGGTIYVPLPEGAPPGWTVDVPWMADGRLLWETPLDGLTFGASVLGAQAIADTVAQGKMTHVDLHALLWLASVEYLRGRLRLDAEYGRWNVRTFVTPPQKLSNVPTGMLISERYYVQGAWRFTDDLEAGLYYAGLFSDIFHRTTPGSFQHDVALSFRYDLTMHWLVKLELHYLHGTAGLQAALNGVGNGDLGKLTQDWGLVLVRTTAYF